MSTRRAIPLLLALWLPLPASPAQETPGVLEPPPPPPKAKPATPDPRPPADRRPPPPAEEQKQAEKAIRDLFRDAYAKRQPDEVRDLARTLLQNGRDTKDDPASQFVLLREARDAAARAGDPKMAVEAVDVLTARFAVDDMKMKADALGEIRRKVRTPEAARAFVEVCLAVIDAAEEKEDFDGAVALAKETESTAQAAQDAGLLARFRARAVELRALQEESRRVRSSLARLEEQPDDPAANLAAGKYWCLCRDAWEKGLPMLAKGSDRRLQDLAQRELAAPAAADAQKLLGDGWWDAAQKETSRTEKGRFLGRALHWYEKALPALKGLARLQVQERINACYEQARFGTRYVFVAEKSMKPYPVGFKQMAFPAMETDDPTGPFQGKPFYFDQRTGTDVVYDIRSDIRLRSLYWKGSAMQRMKIEILDAAGNILAEGGPYEGGNKWAEFTLEFPPSSRFTLRLRNHISTWYLIDTIRLQ
jgi:hypothetical protein